MGHYFYKADINHLPAGAKLRQYRLAVKSESQRYRRRRIAIKPIAIGGKQHLQSSQELI